ncbi:TerD family protein [bacterium]|nr:TerD family protein [bacterium]
MSVSLSKGQKVSLSKERAGLTKIRAALGWDEAQPEKKSGGFLSSLFSAMSAPTDIDCDASAILLVGNKLRRDPEDVVYYGNLNHSSGAVNHMGDNLTGAGDGDCEVIEIDLAKVPNLYTRIAIVVNIYNAVSRHQHFGMIKNAYIRLIDTSNNQEMCKYDLSDDYSGAYAVIVGEVYRDGAEWKFNAIGEGTKDHSLRALLDKRFK